jgi:hypothetical protein
LGSRKSCLSGCNLVSVHALYRKRQEMQVRHLFCRRDIQADTGRNRQS